MRTGAALNGLPPTSPPASGVGASPPPRADPMTPLETAMLIAKSDKVVREPSTGLYIVGREAMTFAQYESGMRILLLREKIATAQLTR